MRARDTEVANLVAIDDPCAGCVLAEGHFVKPNFVDLSLSVSNESIDTRLTVSSYNGSLKTTEVALPGVLRKDQLIERFNTPIAGKTVACNAICAMILERRRNN